MFIYARNMRSSFYRKVKRTTKASKGERIKEINKEIERAMDI